MKSLQEKLVIEQRNLLSLKSELLNLKSQAVGDFTKTPEYATIMLSISEMSKTIADIISLMPSQHVFGGNIYIQETQPTEPKENDIWFDLGSIN
jgi:predicted choloylglycine hydrolase